MKRFAVRGLLGLVMMSALLVTAFALPSDAHTNVVTAAESCDSASTWTASLTVTSTHTDQPEVLSVLSAPSAGTVSGAPANVAANRSTVVSISSVPISTTSVTITLHGAWADGFVANTTFTASAPATGCAPSPTATTTTTAPPPAPTTTTQPLPGEENALPPITPGPVVNGEVVTNGNG